MRSERKLYEEVSPVKFQIKKSMAKVGRGGGLPEENTGTEKRGSERL